jgi:hypothetical protein
LFSTLRCICGDNENRGELVQCHDCHCFLHAVCLESLPCESPNLRCPFCTLQLEGADPFRDLRTWVNAALSELKVLCGLIGEGSAIDTQVRLAAVGPDYGLPLTPAMHAQRQNVPHLMNALQRTVNEINQHIATLVNY